MTGVPGVAGSDAPAPDGTAGSPAAAAGSTGGGPAAAGAAGSPAVEPGGAPPDPTVPGPEPAGGSLSRQAGVVILARAIAFVIAFAVPIIMVRVISQEQYGHYRQSVFLLALFWPMLQIGMTQSLFYFYPRDPARRIALVTQTQIFLVCTGVLFAVLFTAGRGLVGAYFNDPVMAGLAPLIGLYICLMVVASILDVLPIAQQKVRLAFWTIIGSESLRAILLLGAAVLTRDVRVLLIALTVHSAARTVTQLFVLRHQRLLDPRRLDLSYLKGQAAYALPFGLAGVAVTLIKTVDRLYVSRYFDASEFAVYAVGCFQLPIIMIVFHSAASVMLGRMAELQAAGRTGEMRALLRNAARKLGLVALPTFAVSLVLARDLITVLYTDAYAESVPIFMIYLALILRAGTAYSMVTRAYGLTAWILRVTLVALAAAVALVFVLTPLLGLIGPAIAVVTALWIVAVAQIWKSGRLLGSGVSGLYPWKDLGRIGGLAAVLALLHWAVCASVPISPVVRLAAGGPLFVALYGLIAVKTGLIRPDEVAAARRELVRRLGIVRRLEG